jgi:hypothetical protein
MPTPTQSLTTNPVIVTGVMAQSYKAGVATLGTFQTCIIKHIRWSEPGTSGSFIITDPIDGHVIASGNSTANNDQIIDWSAKPLLVRDFIVSTLSGGGYLEIHLA